MAGEIKTTLSLVIAKGGAYATMPPSSTSYTADLSGVRCNSWVQGLTTTDEALTRGEISFALGLLCVKNLSSVAGEDVELSYGTGGSFSANIIARVSYGKPCYFQPRSGTTEIYAKSLSGTPSIQCCASEA